MKRKLEDILADVLSGFPAEKLPAEERALLHASAEGREALEAAAFAAALDARRGEGLSAAAIEGTWTRLKAIASAGDRQQPGGFSFFEWLRDFAGGIPRGAWAAAAAAIALFIFAPGLMPEEKVGRLAFAESETFLGGGSAPRKIPAGAPNEIVRCEYALETAEGGAIMSYDAGATVFYGRSTKTRINGEREFELEEGAVWVEVAKNPEGFGVRTAEADIRVLGTKFEIARDSTGTRVSVVEGSVRVTSLSTGAAATLKPGDAVSVAAGIRTLGLAARTSDTPQWVAQLTDAATAASVGPLLPSVTGGPSGDGSP